MKVPFITPFISAVIMAVALTACQSLDVSRTPTSPSQKYHQMYSPTVVVINQVEGTLGSGVLVHRSRDEYLVLTAWHVVTDQAFVEIVIPDYPQVRYLGKVLRVSQEQDLALVYVKMHQDRPSARLCVNEPEMFEEVFAVGAGLAQPVFPTSGIVANIRYYFEDWPNTRYIHHSAPISPGNSGGPLYKYENGNYCVTGINLRGRVAFSQYSYAAHLFELYSFLRISSAKET